MRFFLYGLIIIMVIVSMVAVLLLGFSIISQDVFYALAFGSLLAMVFVSAGYYSFIWALKYQQKKFNKIVGFSILLRLMLMTLSILSILIFSNIAKTAFLIGMFVSYFLTQIWEVISFKRIKIG
jgi:hypothetical protein